MKAVLKNYLRESIDENISVKPWSGKIRIQIFLQELTEIEIWLYNPKLLSNDKYVNIVSMALALQELGDERLEQAIAKRLGSEAWYME